MMVTHYRTSGAAVLATSVSTGAPDQTYAITAGNVATYASVGHTSRIQQNGSVASLYMYHSNGANVDSMVARVFRYVSGIGASAVYNEVGNANVIIGTPTEAWKEYALSATIDNVLVGDILAITTTAAGGGNTQAKYKSGIAVEDGAICWATSALTGDGVSFTNYAEGYQFSCVPKMYAAPCVTFGDSFFSDLSPSFFWTLASGTWEAVTMGQGISDLLYAKDSTLFNVRNMGRGSMTASNWSPLGNNYVAYVTAAVPKFAIIHLGINDIATGRTLAQYKADMVSIFQTLTSVSIMPVMLSIGQVNTSYPAARGWNEWLRKYCGECGYPFIDIWKMFGAYGAEDGRNTTLFGTGIHPNLAGYKAISTLIADALFSRSW